MSKKRVNYSYGTGFGDVFLSLQQRRFFSVYNEEDRAALHAAYGGKQYYRSRSGLSGAGYLAPEENDLVNLPTYRTDTVHVEYGSAAKVCGVELSVPIAGRMLDGTDPIVVVFRDRNERNPRLVFLPARADLLVHLLVEGVGALEDDGWKKFCPYYTEARHPDENGWQIFRYTHHGLHPFMRGAGELDFQAVTLEVPYAGVVPQRLAEYIGQFAGVRKEWQQGELGASPSAIDQAMGLLRCNGAWVRLGLFELVREVWDENPRRPGETVRHSTGWTTIGTHFAHKRMWNDRIRCILERPRADLGTAATELPELIELERDVNLAEFYVKGIDAIIIEMDASLREKASKEAQYASSSATPPDEFVYVDEAS